MPVPNQRIFFRAALLVTTTPVTIVQPQIDWQAWRLALRAMLRAKLGLDAEPAR
jgi:hypothetical protein